jgi:hypothetical protein
MTIAGCSGLLNSAEQQEKVPLLCSFLPPSINHTRCKLSRPRYLERPTLTPHKHSPWCSCTQIAPQIGAALLSALCAENSHGRAAAAAAAAAAATTATRFALTLCQGAKSSWLKKPCYSCGPYPNDCASKLYPHQIEAMHISCK